MNKKFNLYNLLSNTQWNQKIIIYKINDYDESIILYKGEAEEARTDEQVWWYLEDGIVSCEAISDYLIVGIEFEGRACDLYSSKQNKERRLWLVGLELDKKIAELINQSEEDGVTFTI